MVLPTEILAEVAGEEQPIVGIFFDPERGDGGVFCRLHDGRVFLTVGESILPYYSPADGDDVCRAFSRAWSHKPELFRGPIKPRVSMVATPETGGMAQDLTPEDRQRLYVILRRYKHLYFAGEPTIAQLDNLIDCFGVRAAEKLVKKHVDAGNL